MAKKAVKKHPSKPLKSKCAACGEIAKAGMMTKEGKKFCNTVCKDNYKKRT